MRDPESMGDDAGRCCTVSSHRYWNDSRHTWRVGGIGWDVVLETVSGIISGSKEERAGLCAGS